MKPVLYHILLSLASGPIHGAEIRRSVDARSGVGLRLYPARLYGSLDHLVAEEWIEEVDDPEATSRSTRWRFYQLTPAGRRALEEETARLGDLVDAARAALGGAAS